MTTTDSLSAESRQRAPRAAVTTALLGAVALLLAAQTAHAAQATVVGIIRNGETGEPLAGAVVALTDLNRATATDDDGRYVLRHVPVGPQHITVRYIGYAHHSLLAIVPQDRQLEINVALRPEPMSLPAVVVRAPVIIRGVDIGDRTAFPDRGSSIAAVRNHPLLAEPDVFQALGGGEVVLRPETPGGVHIRGGASDQTAYLLDGMPVFSPYHAAGVSSAWNPDALSRLHLSSSAPSLTYPHTLSGAIEAVTRTPGDRLSTQGSASTTQTRLTVDGPLGLAGAGFVIGFRSGLPGVIAPKDDADYLLGETGDWLAKVEVPALGGRGRLLGYDSDNEIQAATAAAIRDSSSQASRDNAFEWHSRSLGVEWKRSFSGIELRLLSWTAAGDASSDWTTEAARVRMTSARDDEGLLAALEHRSTRATTTAGVRFERSRTTYRIESDSISVPSWELGARTPVTAVFAQHARAIGPGIELAMGGAVAVAAGELHVEPRAQLRWNPSQQLALSGSYARTHQFAQSLRNAESVVGSVFPVDLYIGAGAPRVPVARSDQVVIAAEYRPVAEVRFSVQAYERAADGLLLVAPRDGGPFTTGAFAVGSGASRGVSADAAFSTARYGIVASYGLQRARLEYDGFSYVPDHGATHLLEAGVIVFPTATFSIRVGATGGLGRRTTIVNGGFAWEACNLLDRGCEFGGGPHYDGEALGATELPAYYLVDLGLRKHWSVKVGRRDASIALYGTATNILGRENVLTYSRNDATGQLKAIEMRPRAPLVVGVDWRF